MRDPNRIPEILALLQEGWSKVPDWRFGQLIENLKRYVGREDLFFTEDDEMAEIIKDYFNLDEKEEEKKMASISIPEIDVGKYFKSVIKNFIGDPEDFLLVGDGNPPKGEVIPEKKPKWEISYRYIDGGSGETHTIDYLYANKYSAKRAALRLFGESGDLVVWDVKQV